MARLISEFPIKGRKLRISVGLFLLALLWLLSWVGARWLIVSAPLNHADAIVVLSGSSTINERVRHAAKLFTEERASKIILTNDNRQGSWSQSEQRNPFFYETARKELERLGVPFDSIVVLMSPVDSTWDEALRVREYARANGFHSILIVTSSYHSRRALSTFRTLFPTDCKIGIDPVETGILTPRPLTWWLHLRGWRFVLPEYIKLIYYQLRSQEKAALRFGMAVQLSVYNNVKTR